MADEADPLEYLRQLGSNFAAWRRYNLLTNRELLRKLKREEPNLSENILSKFETGKLADFVQAAAEEMCMDVTDFLKPPPDKDTLVRDMRVIDVEEELTSEPIPEEYDEYQVDAMSWVKFDKNTDAEKFGVVDNVNSYAERVGLTDEERQDLIDMLIAPARAVKIR